MAWTIDMEEVSLHNVEKHLDKWGDKSYMVKVINTAIKDAAKVLKKAVEESLLTKIPSARTVNSKSQSTRWYKWQRPLIQGIKVGKMRYGDGYYVSILPDGRLKWFENGTKPRYTKSQKINGYMSKSFETWRDAYGRFSKEGIRTDVTRHNILDRSGKGHFTGRIPEDKYTFLAPALDKSWDNAEDAIERSIMNALNKAV